MAAVLAAVDRVVDPCSAAMGTPIGLAELGLLTVESIDEDSGAIRLHLRLTSPCCSYGPMLATAVEHVLGELEWVSVASVQIDHDVIWSEAEIAPATAARLAARRDLTRTLTGVRPFDWTGDRDGDRDGERDG